MFWDVFGYIYVSIFLGFFLGFLVGVDWKLYPKKYSLAVIVGNLFATFILAAVVTFLMGY